MKRLITGLATGLLFAGAPAWADSWKDESGRSWRGSHAAQQVRHSDHRWERDHRYHPRHHRQGYRPHNRYRDHHRHYRAPQRHHYYSRDYSYYYAPGAYVNPPSIYFSWSSGY